LSQEPAEPTPLRSHRPPLRPAIIHFFERLLRRKRRGGPGGDGGSPDIVTVFRHETEVFLGGNLPLSDANPQGIGYRSRELNKPPVGNAR